MNSKEKFVKTIKNHNLNFQIFTLISALILHFCPDPSDGLLKNCVRDADFRKDTVNPKCEIIVPRGTTIDCYGPDELSLPRTPGNSRPLDNMIICQAPYPIDVETVGVKLKGFPYYYYLRSAPNIMDPTGFEYFIKIPININQWSARSFTFYNVKKPSFQTKFYLYQPALTDQVLPYNWPGEKQDTEVITELEPKIAVVPCTVNNRSDVVTLKRSGPGIPGSEDVVVDNKTVQYDPKAGFFVDTTGNPPGVYTYECRARNRRRKGALETLSIKFGIPEDVSFDPQEDDLYKFSGFPIILTCKSIEEVKVTGTINGEPISETSVAYTNDPSHYLPHKGIFRVSNPSDNDSLVINCETIIKNQSKVKTWKINVLDLYSNDILQFNNEVNTSTASCQSKTSEISLFNSECMNKGVCEARGPSFGLLGVGQCNLRLSTIVCGRAEDCDVRHPEGEFKECLKPPGLNSKGVIKCETETLSHIIHYIRGIDGNLYSDIFGNEPPTDKLIGITLPPRIYYNSLATVKCEATTFLSSGEFKWLLRKLDGTLIEPKVMAIRSNLDYLTTKNSIWEADIWIEDHELDILCLVPIWNSDKWLNVSMTLDIKGPVRPTIVREEGDEGETPHRKFFIGDDDSIVCEATGDPPPVIFWQKDRMNFSVPGQDVRDDGKVAVDFDNVKQEYEGTYTCVAVNFVGTDSLDYEVEVEEKPNFVLYIILGTTLLILLIGTLGWLYWKLLRARSKIRNLTDDEVNDFHNGNPEAAEAAKNPSEAILHLPYNLDYEIPRDKLKFGKRSKKFHLNEHDEPKIFKIDRDLNLSILNKDELNVLGSGAFGMVLRGQLADYPDEVAIKTVKPFSEVSYFKALLSELKIMIYLGKHENVVSLIGAYTAKIKERVLYMVVELSPYGNLEDYLRKNQRLFQNQVRNDKICITRNMMKAMYANMKRPQSEMYINPLSTYELVSWAYQIAEGMNHLASKKVIHADLATRNVLLYDRGIVKITDFGLSRQLYAYTSYMKKEQEPLPWRSMAIESLREMNFSTQSDVWAYGVCLWEMFTLGAVPYPGLSWSIDFVDMLLRGLRLSKPDYATTDIYNVMVQCWHTEPEKRHTFEELRDIFYSLRCKLENMEIDLDSGKGQS